MEDSYAIELRGITKRFGSVVANDHIDLAVKKHEILSILGENGSGKTTLMNMIAGIYRPDEGSIYVNGKEVFIHSPLDAYALKIGMIHQHYKLVNVFTALENILLGLNGPLLLDMKQIKSDIEAICSKFGFSLQLDRKIYEMSVSEKQTVEIVKALYRGADILILDEPTAVLTPQEIKSLFAILRTMRDDGKAVVIITHKLNEVMELSDRVAVLRKGVYIGSVHTADATADSLTEMMVGEKKSLNIQRPRPHDTCDRLRVEHLTVYTKDGIKAVDDASFTARAGEILGIAGIAGSGMKELMDAFVGVQHAAGGRITVCGRDGVERDITNRTPRQILRSGAAISYIPEDRLGMGLVGSMGMTGNMMLKTYTDGAGPVIRRTGPRALAEKMRRFLEIVTPGTEYPVRRLSGGNVQKVLLGREIASKPDVLLASYPVRGLDINSSYTVYDQLTAQKECGAAVIAVIEDLDVILELCDRIIVLNNGRITGIVDAYTATKEQIGKLMTAGRYSA